MFKKKKVSETEDLNKMTDQKHSQEEEIKDEIEQVNESTFNGVDDLPENEVNEVDKLKDEVAMLNDKYIRMYAEFDNYKRRTTKERIDLLQTAGKDVIVSLLDVLDDVDRAEKQLANNDDVSLQKEGITLVFNKVRSTLQAKGVKALESINTTFDVEKHEAITEIPAPSNKMKGKVLDEVQKGYYLNDKLIRFAKVVVGN